MKPTLSRLTDMQIPKPIGHLLITVLSYDRRLDDRVSDAIYAALPSLAMMGWRCTIIREVGNADLCDARNTLCAQFYGMKEVTRMLCIDGDISYPPGSIERIISWDVDLVGCTYPKRGDGHGYALKTLPLRQKLIDPVTGEDRPDGLLQVAGLPTGFLCISRNCIDKMVEANADSWYANPRVITKKAWELFTFSIRDHERWGEDINFCWKWRQLGGKVWLDPHILMHHHGDKTYSGKAIDYLRETNWMHATSAKRRVIDLSLDASNDPGN